MLSMAEEGLTQYEKTLYIFMYIYDIFSRWIWPCSVLNSEMELNYSVHVTQRLKTDEQNILWSFLTLKYVNISVFIDGQRRSRTTIKLFTDN